MVRDTLKMLNKYQITLLLSFSPFVIWPHFLREQRGPRCLNLCPLMLSAFKSVTSITESRKLISYLCAYAEKFREKQTNQLGLNCLKIDSYSQNLLENEERKCRPPPNTLKTQLASLLLLRDSRKVLHFHGLSHTLILIEINYLRIYLLKHIILIRMLGTL